MRLRLLFAAAAAALAGFRRRASGRARHAAHDDGRACRADERLPLQSRVDLDECRTGQALPLGALGGKPVVAAMGYTSCKDMCPAIVADMMWIEKHLPQDASGRVSFAFFSIDSKVDTPAKLKAYADEHGFDPARWMLLHGDDDAVRELAAALGVGYRPDGQGGFDHAAVISLIDEKGEIVVQQRGTQASSDELLAALNSLLEKRN